jgi:hypothetical protein
MGNLEGNEAFSAGAARLDGASDRLELVRTPFV